MSASSPHKPTIRIGHSMQPNRGRLIAFWDAKIRGRHAPKEEVREEEDFEQKFLHQDYFYNHAEPHRRRPTLVTFPRFITHTATFFSKADTAQTDTPQTSFREWLSQFKESDEWRKRMSTDSPDDGDPWEESIRIDPEVLERLSWIAQPSLEEERRLEELKEEPTRRPEDVEFFIELIHRDYPEVVARIEAHLEFFTLTLFKPLPDPFNVATVYDEYGPPQLVPKGKPDPKNPFHKLYDCLVDKFPKRTFAHFKGVVVGPKAFHPQPSYPAAPSFPLPGSSAPMDRDVATSTAMFLRGQKKAFKKGLFAASDEDVVACYFQRGQVIYVSALGAQMDTNSRDELRYLLIYNDTPLRGRTYDCFADRYRLSRLVHRVNTIGTLRLAALRDLRKLRRAGDELRRIETGVEIAAHDEMPRSRVRKLGDMIVRLDSMVRAYAARGTPLFYRTARASLYFEQMKKLLEDLGADPIPEWQSYNQFLSRRLFAQQEFNATLGNRISELGALARSHAEVAEADALSWLQRAAQISSLILLPPAVADMLRDRTSLRTIFGALHEAVTGWLARVVFDVRPMEAKAWHWLPKDVQSWWQCPEHQEFWLLWALIFCVWLTCILLVRRRRERMLIIGTRGGIRDKTHRETVATKRAIIRAD